MDIQKFPLCMADIPVDLKHPNRTLVHGLFEEFATVGGVKRRFLTYIPKNLEYCQPCLVTAIPSNVKAEEFLETSGLRQFAEDHQLFLHLALPEENWNKDGNDADYLNMIYVAIQARDYYVTMQDNIYLCGIGDASFAAHQAAKRMASEWSGLMTFGNLDGDLAQDAQVLRGEESQGEVELKIMGTKAQLPVWMYLTDINDVNNHAAIQYWKEQNHVIGTPLSGAGADEIWAPTPVRVHSEVNEEYIAQVRIAVGRDGFSVKRLEDAWSYIGLARRHRGQGRKCLRYFKDPVACGAVKLEKEVDGIMRTWYEYVPSECTPDQAWPLVFVFHGRGGTAETFFDLSGISALAEARKFIAVIPQAGLYQQKEHGLRNVLVWCGEYQGKFIDDVRFVREIYSDIQTRHIIDRSRVYAMGQSSGGMMSDVLAYTAGDIFVAAAPWSALKSNDVIRTDYQPGERKVPVMWIYGDQDFLCISKEGPDPELPFSPAKSMRATLMKKIESSHLELSRVESWRADPITWYCYPNEQGIPMLVVGVVSNMVHANYPEESWIAYDQFLCQFSKDEEGNICYRGKKVIE